MEETPRLGREKKEKEKEDEDTVPFFFFNGLFKHSLLISLNIFLHFYIITIFKILKVHGFLRQMEHFLTDMSNRVEPQNEAKRPQIGGRLGLFW